MKKSSKDIIDTLMSCKNKKEAARLLGITVKNKVSLNSKLKRELINLGIPENYFDPDIIKERELEYYISHPKLCKECGKVISFEYRNIRSFCSSTCSARYNNRLRERSDESKKKTSETLKKKYKRNFFLNDIEYNMTPTEAAEAYESGKLDFITIQKYFPELIKVCKNCEKTYVIKPNVNGSIVSRRSALFCSIECANEYQHKDSLLYISDSSNKKKEIKREYLNYRGGKCVVCGYDRCEYAMDFHHVYSWNKKKNITEYINRLKSIDYPGVKEELDKCVILCSTHHRELHAGLIDISDYVNLDEISKE